MKRLLLLVAIAFGASHIVAAANDKQVKQTTVSEIDPGGDDGGIPVPPPKPKFP